MPIDKIQFQYPEETIKVDNYHNVIVPNKGDFIKKGEKEYRVKYRIFDTGSGIVTVVLEELHDVKI